MIDGTFFPPSKLTRADFHSWAFNPLTSNQICHINDADALKLCICSSEHALPRFYSMRDSQVRKNTVQVCDFITKNMHLPTYVK